MSCRYALKTAANISGRSTIALVRPALSLSSSSSSVSSTSSSCLSRSAAFPVFFPSLTSSCSSTTLKQPIRSFYSTQLPSRGDSTMHATTILAVRKGNHVCMIGDGQVSLGPTVVKANARKVRIIGGGKVVCGFAGSTADCFALLDRLEKKLEEYPGQLLRAAVEMAKEWRSDKYLRQLEAWMIACDKETQVTITGNGDVMAAPEDGCMAIGSGGHFAVAAARALMQVASAPPQQQGTSASSSSSSSASSLASSSSSSSPVSSSSSPSSSSEPTSSSQSQPLVQLSAREIAERAMNIAADICIYTNRNFVIEEMIDGQILSRKNEGNKDSKDATSSAETKSS